MLITSACVKSAHYTFDLCMLFYFELEEAMADCLEVRAS